MVECEAGETRACPAEDNCPQGVQTCVDGQFGPCVGPAELCDGADNDCDGEIDEDYDVDEACVVGVGACAAEGTTVCTEDGEDTICDALPGNPQDEICNNIDDNCDGVVDEGFMVGIPCTGGLGACLADGMQICGEDGEVICSADAPEPTPEICDGVDNDCDGSTDEEVPGSDERPIGEACTAGLGACESAGVYGCGAENEIVCLASDIPPAEELCNDVDDDCDGSTDEDFSGDVERPLGEACEVGLGACVNTGVYICDAVGGVQCSAQPLPNQVERCDGLDNDCDGLVDEDFDLGGGCLVGIGACAAEGVIICDGLGGTTCQGQPNPPGIETCNGIDDNCNGVTDEGFEVGDPCAEGVGACRAEGVTVCNAQGEVVCSETEEVPVPEACNGVDDDCDGAIDEDFDLGISCEAGTGACVTEGVAACSGTPDTEVLSFSGIRNDVTVDELELGGFEQCWSENYIEGRTPITNDRVDPLTDEVQPSIRNRCTENVLVVGCREAGTNALRVAAMGEQDGIFTETEFADRTPENIHNGVNWYFNPDYAWGFAPAGADLDVFTCDRVVDDQSNQRVCWYTSDDRVRPGYRCGDVIVRQGQAWERLIYQRVGTLTRGAIGEVICQADPVEPGVESCNNFDDDCDAAVDEDFPLGEACTNGVGECVREGVFICGEDGGATCNAVAGAPADELCDGLDNDCDGLVDETFPLGEDCSNGNGACVEQGDYICNPDDPTGVICDAVPSEPVLQEICNYFDDDCDGLVDEGLGACEDVYTSCQDAYSEGERADGAIELRPIPEQRAYTTYCDQQTDGGGWTLVASSREGTINDQRSDHHNDLDTLAPGGFNLGIWDGLRDLSDRFDVRFACRDEIGAANAPFTVDLTFYDTTWYHIFTEGNDRASCFYAGDDVVPGTPPARRNNLTGEEIEAGVDWANGLLSERRCQDGGDFAIDFNDGGLVGDPNDGTDWGESRGARRCGVSNLATGQWFIFVRERD